MLEERRSSYWEQSGSTRGPPKRVAMPVHPAGLTDAEVQTSLVHMAQAITMKALAIISKVNRQNVEKGNTSVRSMDDKLRDFTIMNPPFFIGSNTLEDRQKFINEVNKVLVAMGATDTEKTKLASYHLKDVAQTWFKI